MKVLVATKETQGHRESDFSFVEEGELVRLSLECDSDKDNIDGRCGCRRSMSGLVSHKATTTMKVIDMDLGEDEYKQKLRKSLKDGGWITQMEEDKIVEMVDELSKELLEIADNFEIGDVVEKRGDDYNQRK